MNPFYNHEEKRLRALWRLILQTVLFLTGMFLMSVLVGASVAAIKLSQGEINLDMMSDPQTASNLIMDSIGGWGQAFISLGMVVLMVLIFLIAGKFLDKRKFADFGFHFSKLWWKDFGFGLFLGGILMLFIFVVELAFGWVKVTGFMNNLSLVPFLGGILTALVTFISVGIYEEMLSRGYHLRNMAEGLNWKIFGARGGLWLGYIISSSIFGLLHATNENATIISTFNLVIAGLFLGLGYILTGELGLSIGLHMTWNFFQGNVFGFPVSGSSIGTSLINIEQSGPNLLTGGAFGPEAGLIGIIAILIGSLLTVLYVRKTRGHARVCYDLAQYKKPGAALVAETVNQDQTAVIEV